MATTPANPNRRKRRSAAPAPAPAPSRIRNKRQQQIVETVEGYESIVSYGAALQAVHFLWALVGVSVVGLGAGTMVLSTSETGSTLLRTYQALGYGMALLTGVTLLASLVWAGQAAFNVTKLGRTPSFGQVAIVGRHVPGLVVGAGLLIAAGRFDSFERPFRILGGAALVWGLMVIAGLGAGALNMLWRTSALGDSSKVQANRDFRLWFAGLLLFSFGSTAVESLGDVTMAASGFLILLTGIGILLAAVMAIRFIPLIGQRQEERVGAIMMSFNDEDPGSQPVTAQQIEDAWEASSDLFSVDF